MNVPLTSTVDALFTTVIVFSLSRLLALIVKPPANPALPTVNEPLFNNAVVIAEARTVRLAAAVVAIDKLPLASITMLLMLFAALSVIPDVTISASSY